MSIATPSIGLVTITHNCDVEPLIDAWEDTDAFKEIDMVIVEGGTTDKELLEHNRDACLRHDVKRRWVPKQGHQTRSIARNYGAMYVDGEYLLFVDGDCYPEDFEMINMLRYMATPNAVLNFQINFTDEHGEFMYGDHRAPWMANDRGIHISYDPWMMHEQAFMVHRSYFQAVGGFDVSWAKSGFCFEGIEMYTRMFAKFHTSILLVPNISFEHQWHPKDDDAVNTRENLPLLKERMRQTFKEENVDHLLWAKMMLNGVLAGEGEEQYDIR